MKSYDFGDGAPPPLDLSKDKKAAAALINIEAEQALLGAILYENDTFHRLPEGLEPEHFAEPFHARMWRFIAARIGKGVLAEPIMIMERFKGDPAFADLGGLGYLADLIDRAPPAVNAPSFATTITDLATKRTLVGIADAIRAQAINGAEPSTGAEMLEDAERMLLAIKVSTVGLDLVSTADASAMVMDHLDKDSTTAKGGVQSGLRPLDNVIGPALPGDLILLGGRPGMGKSTVEGNWVLNVAGPHLSMIGETGDPFEIDFKTRQLPGAKGVIKVSLEMPVKQTTWRMLADIAFRIYGPPAPTYSQIRKRMVTATQMDMLREARLYFDALPLIQVKRSGLRVGQLRSMVRRQKMLWEREGIELGLVTVDHAGLLHPDEPMRSEYDAQSWIARAMKELGSEVDAPILVLIQLSREVEKRDDKRPQLADLRASGQWEENADVVLLAFREAYYALREKEPPDTGAAGVMMKHAEWDRRRKSRALELIGGKVRDSEGGDAMLWCSIGHHAVRGVAPDDPSRML